MKKIYEAPEFDIEKFQFLNVLGVSTDDPDDTSQYASDIWGDDDDNPFDD